MRCPFCAHEDSQVKDSRPSEDGAAIRRRRQCEACGARFTTFERVQLRDLTVVKKDGKREPFDRDKLALNAADQAIDLRRIDLALPCRMADRPGELVAIERLALAIFLDDREVAKLDSLKGCEAGSAGLALPAAPNCRAIFRRAAVLHLAVFMGAKGATHQL